MEASSVVVGVVFGVIFGIVVGIVVGSAGGSGSGRGLRIGLSSIVSAIHLIPVNVADVLVLIFNLLHVSGLVLNVRNFKETTLVGHNEVNGTTNSGSITSQNLSMIVEGVQLKLRHCTKHRCIR